MARKTSKKKTSRKTTRATTARKTSRAGSARAAGKRASKKTKRGRPPVEGELIRLTALQLAIVGSIESAPKREQYGSKIIEDVAADLRLDEMPLATVYTALRRLEGRGMLTSRWGAPGPDGGNRRRFYKATPAASSATRTLARILSKRVGTGKR